MLPGYAASPRSAALGTPHRVDFLASPCVPSPVSSIRTPKLPLLPLWEKGVVGMRGMGARASPPASPRPGYAGVSLVCAFPTVNQATLRCIIKQPEDNIACRITVLRLTPAGFRRQRKRRWGRRKIAAVQRPIPASVPATLLACGRVRAEGRLQQLCRHPPCFLR